MSGRNKRKADDDFEAARANLQDVGDTDGMSLSPLQSPSTTSRQLARPSKKQRGNEITGRPLALPRLLETLDAGSLRSVLQAICDRHPQIGSEVITSAPKPSVTSALSVLEQYQQRLRDSFPYGSDGTSEYAYNRVKAALSALIEALTEFTPHYLPPNESNATSSLSYLDGATNVIHELPDWQNSAHKHHKDNAYDEISRAWALVISESSKRGGGFQLHNDQWDQKLTKHNELSGGKMQIAVNALGSSLDWIGAGPNIGTGDPGSIRSQLLSGTYGANLPVRVGPW